MSKFFKVERLAPNPTIFYMIFTNLHFSWKAVMVLSDIVQSKYQKNLMKRKEAAAKAKADQKAQEQIM